MTLKIIANVPSSSSLYQTPFGTTQPPSQGSGSSNQALGNSNNPFSQFESWTSKLGHILLSFGKDIGVAIATALSVGALKRFGLPTVQNAIGQLKGADSPSALSNEIAKNNQATPGLGTALENVSNTAGGLNGTQLYEVINNAIQTPGSIIDETPGGTAPEFSPIP